MLTALHNLGRETARIVLHSGCVVCGEELPWRARKASCCTTCWGSLPIIRGAKCDSCAMPWSGGAEPFRCILCLENPLPVGWTEAWGHYRGSLERVLHAFKFERHDFLDAPLAELLESTLRGRGDLEFDALIPVPMHRAKLRRRGYNQAELLARALGRRLRILSAPELLRKTLDRNPQSSLPRRERAANVRGAFAAAGRVRRRSLLLVDDICTTGETLRACAKALLDENAARVCAIVVAKA